MLAGRRRSCVYLPRDRGQMTGLQKMAGCNIQKAEFCILFPGGESAMIRRNPKIDDVIRRSPVDYPMRVAGWGLAQDGGTTSFDDSKVIR